MDCIWSKKGGGLVMGCNGGGVGGRVTAAFSWSVVTLSF